MVPPIREIIPSAGEEEGSHTELRNVQPEFCCRKLFAVLKENTRKIVDLIAPYLSHILMNCFLSPPLLADFIFIALPSLAVTTHSLALPASNKPINVAFVL